LVACIENHNRKDDDDEDPSVPAKLGTCMSPQQPQAIDEDDFLNAHMNACRAIICVYNNIATLLNNAI